MDLVALNNELNNDPEGLGYASLLANGTGLVPRAINAQNRLIIKENWLNDRGMVAELVPQHGVTFVDGIFTKLEDISANSKTVERMVHRLYEDERGLNFGDAALQSMFASWSGNALTEAEANALLDLGKSQGSRAEELFGKTVTELEIKNALE